MQQLNKGCEEFTFTPQFPHGSAEATYTGYHVELTNVVGNPALLVNDLGYFEQGTRIEVQMDVRTISGTTAEIYLESRTGPNLLSGRKICGRAPSTLLNEWETVKITWIVGDNDNWISFLCGGGTTAEGVSRFRNPKLTVSNSNPKGVVACSLLRSGGTWVIDSTNFNYGGFSVISSTGDNITLGYKDRGGYSNPIPMVSIDTGYTLGVYGANAGAHTITSSQMKIRLIQPDGSYVTDVNQGGTLRVHVALVYQ